MKLWEKYNIYEGQIFIAADGAKLGHKVLDVKTYEDCGDVITAPFTSSGWVTHKYPNRIDAFKLAMVRYRPLENEEVPPEWVPEEILLGKLGG